MWFFTDLLERYTRSLARSVWPSSGGDEDASRRPVGMSLTREPENGLILPERALTPPPPFVAERRQPVRADDAPAAPAEDAAPVDVAPEAAPAGTEAADEAVAAPRAPVAVEAMPVGVRGELVVRYSDALQRASAREAAGLVDKLGKDKKVRIAELQLITAEVLGEAVTRRTKAEHLSALRESLGCETYMSVPAGNGAAVEFRTH